MMKYSELKRLSTGIKGLDEILHGGLPEKRLYLLQGQPGTGKTTMAFQFLLDGIKNNEPCLYISFSEAKEELDYVAASHGWNIDKIHLLELGAIEEQLKPESQNTVFYPSEVELNQTTKVLFDEVERIKPMRIVFDSISELRMLAESSLKFRRQMLALKQFFSTYDSTVILLDDLTSSQVDLQVQSIVHGVFNLNKTHPSFGEERRRLNIVKLRGTDFLGGHHDYVIKKGGVILFPRMISSEHESDIEPHNVSSGIKEFDQLLGDGLSSGTSALFLGPAGTGKSTLAIQYAYAAAKRGENSAIFAFEEGVHTLLLRSKAIGMNIEKYINSGLIQICKVDPAQMSPGEFVDNIKGLVEKKKLKVVVIDSLNGFFHAMPDEHHLILQLHELLSYLNNKDVLTLLVIAQQGMIGSMMNTPVDITYLADSVIITRYFESSGTVKKAVSVVKQRSGGHETSIREFSFGPKGISFGPPLKDFHGILTGTPQFVGKIHHLKEE